MRAHKRRIVDWLLGFGTGQRIDVSETVDRYERHVRRLPCSDLWLRSPVAHSSLANKTQTYSGNGFVPHKMHTQMYLKICAKRDVNGFAGLCDTIQ